MTIPDMSSSEQAVAPRQTPGQILRAAREARGLHLAVLSMALKVPVRQIEALERDDYQAFKGITFLRGLSHSLCRQLGIDPAPVLAGLPQPASPLSGVPPVPLDASALPGHASNTGAVQGRAISPVVWLLGILMLGGAFALVWWPVTEVTQQTAGPAVAESPAFASPLDQASGPQASASASIEAAASVPEAAAASPALAVSASSLPAMASVAASPAQPQLQAAATRSAVMLRARADAWVELRDKAGQLVLKRQIKAGETVDLELVAPFFIYVSRADTTELFWQGKPVDLLATAQNNETRLQIKP